VIVKVSARRLSFEETKGACHLAYDAEEGESYRFSGGKTWNIADAWANRMTGFKAILMTCGEDNNNVLSFAGTDSLLDVAVDIAQIVSDTPPQYHQALILTRILQGQHENLSLTGHSLGGGLAAYSSVATRVPANTVNPAPLVQAANFRTLFGNNDQIVNYIAGGSEFVSSSIGRNPGRDVTVSASGNWFSRHSVSNVAPGVPLPTRVD
jgi:hypothetical protein